MRRYGAFGPGLLVAGVTAVALLLPRGGVAEEADEQRQWIEACQQEILARYEADAFQVRVQEVGQRDDRWQIQLEFGPPRDPRRHTVGCTYRHGALTSYGYSLPEPPRRADGPAVRPADDSRAPNTPRTPTALTADHRPWAEACRRDALVRYETTGMTVEVTRVSIRPDTRNVFLEFGPPDDPARYRTTCVFKEPLHTRPDTIVTDTTPEPPRRPGTAYDDEQRRLSDACQLAALSRHEIAGFELRTNKITIRPERSLVGVEFGPPRDPQRHRVICSFQPATGMTPTFAYVGPEPPPRRGDPPAGPIATPQGTGGRAP